MAEEPELPGIPEAPEGIKWVQWLSFHLARERDTVKGAPTFFGGLLLVGLVLGFLVANWHYGELIAVQAERIHQQADLIGDYKNKLAGASPNDAAKQIADLRDSLYAAEKQLDQITGAGIPRHLKPEEISKLKDALTPIAKQIGTIFIYATYDARGEAGRYAREFMAVLVSVSIQPIGPILSGPSGENQIGVMVGMKDPEHPSANATAFTNALKQAGFTPTTPKTSDDMPADFDLFVGPKG